MNYIYPAILVMIWSTISMASEVSYTEYSVPFSCANFSLQSAKADMEPQCKGTSNT